MVRSRHRIGVVHGRLRFDCDSLYIFYPQVDVERILQRNNPSQDEEFPRALRLVDENIYFLERQGADYAEAAEYLRRYEALRTRAVHALKVAVEKNLERTLEQVLE